jgi:hypothetical protein
MWDLPLLKDNFSWATAMRYQVPRPCGAVNPAVRWKQDKSLLLVVTIAEGENRSSFAHPYAVSVNRPDVVGTQRDQVQLRDGTRPCDSADEQLSFSVPFFRRRISFENAV